MCVHLYKCNRIYAEAYTNTQFEQIYRNIHTYIYVCIEMLLYFNWIFNECPQRVCGDFNHIFVQVFRILSLRKRSVSRQLITFSLSPSIISLHLLSGKDTTSTITMLCIDVI